MRHSREDGYVLLMALLIITFAGAVAALGVAALSARQSIAAADTAAAHGLAALQQGMHSARDTLRWQPWIPQGDENGASEADGTWSARWVTQTPAPGAPPQSTLTVAVVAGAAQKQLLATLELRPEPRPQGICVSGDVVLAAPLSLAGSGLYCAGSLEGREWLSFAPETLGAEAPDHVRGQLWPVAAAHVAGEIWASGRELHAGEGTGETTWTADTDVHTGEQQAGQLSAAPSPSLLRALREHATDPGPALEGESLDLAQLPAPDSAGAGEGGPARIIALQPDAARPLTISGALPAAIDDLVLLVDGDLTLGGADNPLTVSRGALIVTGRLTIAGVAQHTGHIYAYQLTVTAPWRIAVPETWRSSPLSGLTVPVLLSLTEAAS